MVDSYVHSTSKTYNLRVKRTLKIVELLERLIRTMYD